MTQELFYTSAPRGLRPGSRGFCTVMSTSGMAKNLADRLESLSGYRHVFAPNDPKAELNPVAYSHLRITVGGIAYHVLSRISAAGLDYTQRSNKFAHHIVLDQKERVAAGPAALLAAPGFMESTWEGEPRLCGAGRKPPASTATAGVCRHWQQVAGDAGWAGVLAETAAGASPRVAAIIFKPGVDALSLVVEALALLPVTLRWQVTFSTFYTKLPPEVECQWRFVLAGSPEAKALERSQHTLTIDLSSLLGRAPDGIWSEAARTGVPPKLTVAEVAMPAISGAITPTTQTIGKQADAVGQELDVDWSSLPRGGEIGRQRPPLPGLRGIGAQRRKWLGPALLAGGVVAACLLVLTAVAIATWREIRAGAVAEAPAEKVPIAPVAQSKDIEKQTTKIAAAPPVVPPPDNAEQPETPNDGDLQEGSSGDHDETQRVREPTQPTNVTPVDETPSSPVAATPIITLPEFIDVHSLKPLSTLKESRPHLIPGISNVAKDTCSLELLGGDSVLGGGAFLILRTGAEVKNRRAINVQVENPNGGVLEKEPITVAIFYISSDSLEFEWQLKNLSELTKQRADQLANCVLAIACGGLTRHLALRAPVTVAPPKISFEQSGTNVNFSSIAVWPIRPLYLEAPDSLKQEASALGYSVNGAGTTQLQLTPSISQWPSFLLTIDLQRRQVHQTCNWQLLESNDGSRNSLSSKRNQLVAELNRATASQKTLEDSKLYKKVNDTVELARLTQLIADAQLKVQRLNEQIALIDAVQARKFENHVIPFKVVMKVGDHPVTIVDATAATGIRK